MEMPCLRSSRFCNVGQLAKKVTWFISVLLELPLEFFKKKLKLFGYMFAALEFPWLFITVPICSLLSLVLRFTKE